MRARKCPLCGGSGVDPGDHSASSLRHCARRGLWFRPQPVTVDAADRPDRKQVERTLEGKRRLFDDTLRRAAPFRQLGTLLDVGAGSGEFVNAAAAVGWRALAVDLDGPTIRLSQSPRDGNLLHANAQQLPIRAKSVDVVTYWDALDIVPDPVAALEEAFFVLRPGGLVFVRIRNGPAHLALRRMPFVPARLSVIQTTLFSKRTLRIAFERSGFVDARVEPSPVTAGDPYACGSTSVPWFQLGKTVWSATAKLAAVLTRNAILTGPSLQAFARRPSS